VHNCEHSDVADRLTELHGDGTCEQYVVLVHGDSKRWWQLYGFGYFNGSNDVDGFSQAIGNEPKFNFGESHLYR
jgi:hypothetical protein